MTDLLLFELKRKQPRFADYFFRNTVPLSSRTKG